MKDEINWYSVDLGDAILATMPLYDLQDKLVKIYQESGDSKTMQAFYRYESGELHCKVKVYMSNAFQQVLCLPNAKMCKKPQQKDLTYLAGNQ